VQLSLFAYMATPSHSPFQSLEGETFLYFGPPKSSLPALGASLTPCRSCYNTAPAAQGLWMQKRGEVLTCLQWTIIRLGFTGSNDAVTALSNAAERQRHYLSHKSSDVNFTALCYAGKKRKNFWSQKFSL